VQNDLEHELLELGDFYRERTTISQSLVIFPAKVRGRGGSRLGRQLFQPHCRLSEGCGRSAGSLLKQARRPDDVPMTLN